MALQLSLNRLTELPDPLYAKSFEFLVGGESAKCSTLVADFLSPKIARMRVADPTINYFELETKCSSAQFEQFLSLASGAPIPETGPNVECFFFLSHELGNQELLSHLCPTDKSTKAPLTPANVLSVLHFNEHLELDCEREISFLASHFEEFCDSDLADWDVDRLYILFSHPQFQISNEDFLYAFVLRRAREDMSFISLLEFVHFELLSDVSISQFIEDSSWFWNSLNSAVWMRICDRLLARKQEPAKPVSRTSMRVFVESLVFSMVWVDVVRSMTVARLKQQIQSRTGIPVENQQLSFNGRFLEDRTLAEYGITGGSHLYLNVVGPRTFTIRVRRFEARSEPLMLDVVDHKQVAAIRAVVASQTQCGLDRFVLVYGDVVLEDDKTLADFGISANSELAMRRAGCDEPPPPDSFPVFVKGAGGVRVITINATARMEVSELQEIIAQKARLSVKAQCLVYGGHVLRPDETLGEKGIGRNATIDCRTRAPSAKKPDTNRVVTDDQ
jgi:hypothetical protein